MRINRLLLIVLAIALFHFTDHCSAEDTRFRGLSIGLRAGAGVSNLIGETADTTRHENYIAASTICGFLNIPISNELEIQIEASINKTGLDRDYSFLTFEGPIRISESLRLTYLEMSIIPKFPFNHRTASVVSIYTGATVAHCINSKTEGDYVVPPGLTLSSSHFSAEIGNVKTFNFGILFGFEYRWPIGNFSGSFDIRYVKGLRTIFYDEESPDTIPDDKISYVEFPSGKAEDSKDAALRLSLGISFPI